MERVVPTHVVDVEAVPVAEEHVLVLVVPAIVQVVRPVVKQIRVLVVLVVVVIVAPVPVSFGVIVAANVIIAVMAVEENVVLDVVLVIIRVTVVVLEHADLVAHLIAEIALGHVLTVVLVPPIVTRSVIQGLAP